jgi:F420-dependent oxidoreductase-like protein
MTMEMGVLLWSQGTDWASFEDAARRVDQLGYDHLWTWDHVYAIFGDPYQPIFEGWATLAAWAKVTERVRLGPLVTANTFRNPAHVAKLAATVDHISGGRAIVGLGGAWFELEHTADGYDFGTSAGRRLAWLEEAGGIVRRLLDGEEVTHEGQRYRLDGARHAPRPVQERLPLMIGGSGERKTLRTVAAHADMWNAFGSIETLAHKAGVLRGHCEAIGRDPSEIQFTVGCKPIIRDTEAEAQRVLEELMAHNRTPMHRIADDPSFWVGTAEQLAERVAQFRDIGFGAVIAEIPAPYDDETLTRLVGEVRPMANT